MGGRLGSTRVASCLLSTRASTQFPGLVLSVWCGLVSGLLEVGMIVLAQVDFRSQAALRDEPPFHLADSAGESVPLPGVASTLKTPSFGLASPSKLARASLLMLVDLSPGFPGRLAMDPRSRVVARDTRRRRATGSHARATFGRLQPPDAIEFPGRRRSRADFGGNALGRRLDQTATAERHAAPLTGLRQCPSDRAGYRRGRALESLRLRTSNQPNHGRIGRAGDSLRSGAGDFVLDTAIARKYVHWTLAA